MSPSWEQKWPQNAVSRGWVLSTRGCLFSLRTTGCCPPSPRDEPTGLQSFLFVWRGHKTLFSRLGGKIMWPLFWAVKSHTISKHCEQNPGILGLHSHGLSATHLLRLGNTYNSSLPVLTSNPSFLGLICNWVPCKLISSVLKLLHIKSLP